MYPAYLKAAQSEKLSQIAKQAWEMLASCCICPRKCRVNRLKGKTGYCKTAKRAVVYAYMPHQGEEPPISGTNGSGTIFFSHCNMSCLYCQNYKFSQNGQGREVDLNELAQLMLELQNKGCHNINLVTPTHVMPQILKSLELAVELGLKIPLVYNTSGYELPQVIKMLAGIIDIYLADMRYADNIMSAKFSKVPDYCQYNQAALVEMHRQVGVAYIDESGILKKGLVIRHLVLPQNIAGTQEAMKFISGNISTETYISLMSQYLPCFKAREFPELSRRITLPEYALAQRIMEKCGLHNGWTQESHGLDELSGILIKPNLRLY